MNRGEQEILFRQSANLRLQQEEAKLVRQQLTSGIGMSGGLPNQRHRHYSYGNIHQISNLHSQSTNSRSFGEDRPFATTHYDDLVLSVLKTPVKEGPPSPATPKCAYTALQGSEDELVNDIESANDLSNQAYTAKSPFIFLRRFRHNKRGLLFETHNRRISSPTGRRSLTRIKLNTNILDSECADQEEDASVHDPANTALPSDLAVPSGIPNPYYPIALPIDQAFKTKYIFHHRRGKTFQEKCYVFLEHPGGWICFIYHFTV